MRGAKPESTIRVSAVVLRDDRGGVLTVRKRNTNRFMLPGRKPEAGEPSTAAAIREVAEELAVELDVARLTLLGVFTAEAANEPGRMVEATVYTHPWVAVRGAAAEIEELNCAGNRCGNAPTPATWRRCSLITSFRQCRDAEAALIHRGTGKWGHTRIGRFRRPAMSPSAATGSALSLPCGTSEDRGAQFRGSESLSEPLS